MCNRLSSRPTIFAAVLFAAPMCFLSARSDASYLVTIDTASLVSDSADMPFALSLQLNSGGTAGVSNAATFSDFDFHGGSPDDGSSIYTNGDVASNSSLSSSVSLDTDGGAFSLFNQNFTPGSTITFLLDTTQNLVDPTVDTPDELAVQILDSEGAAIPTVDPDTTDSLLTITYQDPLDIETYGSDTTQQTSAGQTLSFAAPTIELVPEPASALFVGIAAVGLITKRRKRVITDIDGGGRLG